MKKEEWLEPGVTTRVLLHIVKTGRWNIMDKKGKYLVDQFERAMEDEVAAILDQVKPGWAKNMTLGIESGSGVVLDSFFTFSKKASYWIATG